MNENRLKALCGLLIILLLWLVYRGFDPQHVFFTDDIALSLAVGKTALGGFPVLLGPPSHVGGRHLGAVYYWYVILTEVLSGGDDFRALWLFALWKVLAVLLVCALAWGVLDRRWRWWGSAGILIAFCSPGYISIIRTAWHNHFLLIPATLAWLSFLAVLRLGFAGLPVFALFASLLLQSHFSTAPLLLGLGVVIAVFLWQEGGTRGLHRLFRPAWPEICLYLMALATWLPVLLYEFRFPGSFGELLRARAHQTAAPSGMAAALREMAAFGEVLFPGLKGWWTAAILFLFAPPVFAAGRGEKKLVYTVAAAMAVLLSYLLFLSRLGAPLYTSYLYGLLPLPALLVGLSLAAGVSLCRDFASSWTARLLVVSSALGLALIVVQTFTFSPDNRSRPFVAYHSFEAARQMARLIEENNDSGQAALLHARALTGFNRDAILYFLGPAYYNQMQYWDGLREFPQRNESQAGPYSYLISCPKIYSAATREFEAGLGQLWQFIETIDVSGCPLCRNCLVRRYQRAALD